MGHTPAARCSTVHYFYQQVRSTNPAYSRLPRSTSLGLFRVERGGSQRTGGLSSRSRLGAFRCEVDLGDEGLYLRTLGQRRDRKCRKRREFREDRGGGPSWMRGERWGYRGYYGRVKLRRGLLYTTIWTKKCERVTQQYTSGK